MKWDAVVTNGTVVDRGRTGRMDLRIKDGRVESQAPAGGSYPPGIPVIDAAGKLVLPGIIDAHNHPVYADRIGAFSKAALSGGITTLVPYVGSVKAWNLAGGLVDAIKGFIDEAQRESVIDFSVHATLTQNVMDEAAAAIPVLLGMGIMSYKVFTAYKQRGMKLEDEEILAIMSRLSEAGGLLAVHAENDATISHLEHKAVSEGRLAPVHYPPTHPDICEAEALFRVLSLAEVTGCAMYLPHLSAGRSLEVVRMFRRWGRLRALFTETCPHYLTLTDAALASFGNLAKMSPPLRTPDDIAALWEGLAAGEIDVIGSDATGHPVRNKAPLHDQTFAAPYGTADVDNLVALVFDEGVAKGRIPITTLVKTMCEMPARIFGLYPRKGHLGPGADADLLIVDPAVERTLPGRNPHLKTDYSLYAGRRCAGSPVLAMQRGRVVMRDGTVLSEPGAGRFLPGEVRYGPTGRHA
jgi:dihydropyrimidinase